MLNCNIVPEYTPANRFELLAIAKRNITELMSQALAGLTEPQFEAAVLVYQLGMTEAETAEVLGRSQQAVHKSIEQGLVKAKENILRLKVVKPAPISLHIQ